ncbi:MAG TPA: lipid-A-disaccharide synthase [Casimicrobiaceae bacterium]|jgi:lipid-A-disaccharide synthase|nr:lipid-A-disaccharide synthase [Casimicrobiaceae bacterium]
MRQGGEGITIGIVAGEASGDALGAELIAAVRARLPNVRFAGIAGPRMESAGCEAWHSISRLGLRGYAEVAAQLPALVALRRELRRRLVAARASLFVGIDAPDFNLGLEAALKRAGVRTIHYVSPSVWAWRRERITTIARSADRLLTLFPFEPPLYADAGLEVTFVGHPLARTAATAATRRQTRETLRLDREPAFALLPGSRMSELEMHSELLLRVAQQIHEAHPTARFLVPLVSRETREQFEVARHRLDLHELPLTILYGHADQALRAADVGLVASGTATLEAAMARCPHVVFYRVHALTAKIVARKLLLPYVGLPNVLAGRFVVPELLQTDATVPNLVRAALNLYDDGIVRRRLEALFAGMARSLHADTASLVTEAVVAELRAAGTPC